MSGGNGRTPRKQPTMRCGRDPPTLPTALGGIRTRDLKAGTQTTRSDCDAFAGMMRRLRGHRTRIVRQSYDSRAGIARDPYDTTINAAHGHVVGLALY